MLELNVTQIIRQVTASVSSIWLFPPDIQSVVIDTYVQGLRYTYRTLPHLLYASIFPSSTTIFSPNHRSDWPEEDPAFCVPKLTDAKHKQSSHWAVR